MSSVKPSRKRTRSNTDNNEIDVLPPAKKQKIEDKRKTPNNVIRYWVNTQLAGKFALIRHGSHYQIATFKKALVITADSQDELSIQ